MQWSLQNITMWQSMVGAVGLACWIATAVGLVGFAWRTSRGGSRKVRWALAGLAVVGGLGGWLLGVEKRHVRELLACRDNVRTLAFSVESWGAMNGPHDGEVPIGMAYPPTLSALLPDYVADVPTCPSAGTDTYSTTYVPSSEAGAFTVCCGGRHHRIGFTWLVDRPSYDVSRGLWPPEK